MDLGMGCQRHVGGDHQGALGSLAVRLGKAAADGWR